MGVKNFFLCFLGFIFLGIGAVGIFLPVLPTTPFVLAAAGFFASTPRIYGKVIKIPFFKEYIQNYREKKGLRPKTVVISLVFLWSMLTISILHIDALWSVFVLGSVGIAVTVHILWIAGIRNR